MTSEHSVLMGTVGHSLHSCWLGSHEPWEGTSQATFGHVYPVNGQNCRVCRLMVFLTVGALLSVLKGSRELYAGRGACLWELTLQQTWGETGAFPFLVTLLSHHTPAHHPHTGAFLDLLTEGITFVGLGTCFILYLAPSLGHHPFSRLTCPDRVFLGTGLSPTALITATMVSLFHDYCPLR